jgi:hypothetical protein
MSIRSTAKIPAAKLSPTFLLLTFIAGALAVPLFHQLLFLVLFLVHVVPVAPFSLQPTAPLGVPEVLSAFILGRLLGYCLWPDPASLPSWGSVLARLCH